MDIGHLPPEVPGWGLGNAQELRLLTMYVSFHLSHIDAQKYEKNVRFYTHTLAANNAFVSRQKGIRHDLVTTITKRNIG